MRFQRRPQTILAHVLLTALAVAMAMKTAMTTATSSAPADSDSDPDAPRIVGGAETSIERFPHQVSLQHEQQHICGGSIVSARSVLTAAHCVAEPARPQDYRVRAGSSEHRRGGLVRAVQRILRHEAFDAPSTLNNDIALVQLQQPLVFSPSVRPIALADEDDVAATAARRRLLVSGWGSASDEAADMARRLRFAAVEELDRRACAAAYEGAGVVTETMLCAGDRRGGRDSCQGDSGGPLVVAAGGRVALYGIVSWGIGCGHADYPGIYTRVPAYAQWIRANLL